MSSQPIGNHGLGNGQTRIAKPKSAYKSLIISPKGLGW